MLTAYFNNEILPVSEIKIPVNDLIVFRGMGAFDYMRTYNRKPFLLDDHINRFLFSCEQLGLKHGFTKPDLEKKIKYLSEISPLEDSAFRMIMTSGMGATSLEPGESSLIILTEEVHPYPKSVYEHGIKAKLFQFDRYLPTAKSLTYTQAVIELQKAKAEGFSEVIYHSNGMITEGTTCNFFIVNHGKLMTPGKNILAGTRRKFILSWANELIPSEPRHLYLEDLKTATEAFVTSTTRELLPVVQIDDQVIGDGKVGEITKKLHQIYLGKIENEII